MLEQIKAALRLRFPSRTEDEVTQAAVRVHFNLERHGPVSFADRLFLGGPDEDRSDANILIDRTLLEIAARNLARRCEDCAAEAEQMRAVGPDACNAAKYANGPVYCPTCDAPWPLPQEIA